MLPEQFAYITIFISLIGVPFYVRDIFMGKTKPNFVSWFFWMLAPFIGVFLELKAGAGLSVLPVFLAGFVCVPILVAAAIKRNAYWRITFFDVACGVFSFLSILLWVSTKSTDISIVFAILADLFAALPTIIKSWNFPETETAVVYAPGVINNTIGLLIIRKWTFSQYSFGFYFILVNLTLLILISRKKILKLAISH
jgi:hypothetical protein